MKNINALKDEKCCEHMWYGFYNHVCGKPAKIEHENKFYCGIHNPVRLKEKYDKRNKEYERQSKIRSERWHREKLMHQILGSKTTKELELIIADMKVNKEKH